MPQQNIGYCQHRVGPASTDDASARTQSTTSHLRLDMDSPIQRVLPGNNRSLFPPDIRLLPACPASGHRWFSIGLRPNFVFSATCSPGPTDTVTRVSRKTRPSHRPKSPDDPPDRFPGATSLLGSQARLLKQGLGYLRSCRRPLITAESRHRESQ